VIRKRRGNVCDRAPTIGPQQEPPQFSDENADGAGSGKGETAHDGAHGAQADRQHAAADHAACRNGHDMDSMLRLLSFARMTHARDIRVIVSDVDGVWTDGKIIYAGDRSEVKNSMSATASAPSWCKRAGIQIVLLTSRRSATLARRARELSITELHQGATTKRSHAREILESMALTFDQALYIGDDLPDLAPDVARRTLRRAGRCGGGGLRCCLLEIEIGRWTRSLPRTGRAPPARARRVGGSCQGYR